MILYHSNDKFYKFGFVDSNILKLRFYRKLTYIFDIENSNKSCSFLIEDMNINILGNIKNDYL
jgi:hypothetical protein